MSALLNILLLLQGFNPSVAFGEKSLSTLDIAAEDAAGPWSYKDGTGFANDRWWRRLKLRESPFTSRSILTPGANTLRSKGWLRRALACHPKRN